MNEKVYTLLCPFGGLGAGALGFLRAQTRVFQTTARFRLLGGVDVDAAACADFEYLTGVPQLCADVARLRREHLVAAFGDRAPDVVFLSPPCKGASGLLSEKQARKAKYRKLNRLALDWIRLMLEAWSSAPPRLVLFENVPRIKTRARRVLAAVKAHLRRAGYVLHEGFHDCGEVGGLAQHRRRYLLVARHQKSVPSLLYQPPKKRVRACGEVLGELPMPNATEAGPLHRLPQIGWLNWVRLALIPAGGDWRDLPGVLEEGEERRAKFKRHAVEPWVAPVGTIGGSGSNGVENVADPRPGEWYRGTYGVSEWDAPAATVTGSAAASRGRFAVADPRVLGVGRAGPYGVVPWEAPSATVTGSANIDNAPAAVADPRVARKLWEQQGIKTPGERHWFKGKYGVGGWDDPSRAVIGGPSNGAAAIADPRPFTGQRGVKSWNEPASTVTGESLPSNGSHSVADPRIPSLIPQVGNEGLHEDKYNVHGWGESVGTVTGAKGVGSGARSVADPRAREYFGNVLRVVPWGEPTGTVTHSPAPSSGAVAVADPRVRPSELWDRGPCLGVMPWSRPFGTITAGTNPGQGAFSVADPRVEKLTLVGILTLDDARATVTGEIAAPFAIVDPRSDSAPLMVVRDVAKAPPAAPVILAADGTWHRPLTTLELAVLQGLPATVGGKPLQLAGTSNSAHRERIGNAVPVQTAQAIAEQMLLTMLSADLQAFALSSGGSVWVEPSRGLREDA